MTADITATGAFLPGYPVPNDEIEDYIGKAGRASSDLKDLVLTNCGIKTRHYAIDKKQQTVISNAAMAANAVRNAAKRAGFGPNEVELLGAAATIPDLICPGHASMVHGELGYGPLEIATAHGICSSGMMALKNAYLQVAIGEKRNAICVASEFVSRVLKSTRYDEMEAISEDGSLRRAGVGRELGNVCARLGDGHRGRSATGRMRGTRRRRAVQRAGGWFRASADLIRRESR